MNYYTEWLNKSGEFESEEHATLDAAVTRKEQIETNDVVDFVFIGELCPKCARSKNDVRNCFHFFHDGEDR